MATKKKQKKQKVSQESVTTKVEQTQPAGQETQQQPVGAQQQPGGDLQIADLKNIATIIDVASTRGAFRANEMATVGAMFNKLQAFLSKVAPEQKPEDNKAAAPATAER
jgi:hypothetical protein